MTSDFQPFRAVFGPIMVVTFMILEAYGGARPRMEAMLGTGT